MTPEEKEQELNRLLLSRYEMLTAYREACEYMDIVVSRIPAIAENPQYIRERKEMDEKIMETLDKSVTILRALGWEG